MRKLEIENRYAIIENSFTNSNAIVRNKIQNYCNSYLKRELSDHLLEDFKNILTA